MKAWIWPLFLLISACGASTSEEVVSRWPNGEPRDVRVSDEDWPGIEVQQFHENGRIHVRGREVEGQRQGTWNTYRENGNPWSQVEYSNGKKEGLFRTWHPNGMPHIEGQHTAGQPSGSWTFFDTHGQALEVRDFSPSN